MKFMKGAEGAFHAAVTAAVTKGIRESNADVPDVLAARYLEKLNVRPAFSARLAGPEFDRMRDRLANEAGVFISNHPGSPDALALLSMIRRRDVLVLAAKSAHKKMAAAFGADKVIEATADPVLLLRQFRAIADHIERGGLFFLFPTGDSSDEFKDGFRLVIEKILQPSQMVYACWVDPSDIRSLNSERVRRSTGMILDTLLPERFAINVSKETRLVHIDERCTDAKEWQDAIRDLPSKEAKNRALSQHYAHVMRRKVEDAAQSAAMVA